MGILDRLFGTGTSAKSSARKPTTPPAARPVPKAAPQKPVVQTPPAAVPTAAPAAPKPVEEPIAAPQAVVEQPVAVAETPAAAVTESVAEIAAEAAEVITDESAAEETPVEAPVAVAAVEEVATVVEAAEPTVTEPAEPTEPDAATPSAEVAIDAHLQKRLDTYFTRLRQDFPDGNIVRLNTQHKKLAERGAELRRLIGYEGQLDEFFALGGFTYQRSAGGRPSLPSEQTASVEARLREQFPEDVPTVLAVQQADHRLYLDLRAVARRENCTVGEYLDRFRAD